MKSLAASGRGIEASMFLKTLTPNGAGNRTPSDSRIPKDFSKIFL
jgi:hypothetical protein